MMRFSLTRRRPAAHHSPSAQSSATGMLVWVALPEPATHRGYPRADRPLCVASSPDEAADRIRGQHPDHEWLWRESERSNGGRLVAQGHPASPAEPRYFDVVGYVVDVPQDWRLSLRRAVIKQEPTGS